MDRCYVVFVLALEAAYVVDVVPHALHFLA
jgi:hypothetical protein